MNLIPMRRFVMGNHVRDPDVFFAVRGGVCCGLVLRTWWGQWAVEVMWMLAGIMTVVVVVVIDVCLS